MPSGSEVKRSTSVGDIVANISPKKALTSKPPITKPKPALRTKRGTSGCAVPNVETSRGHHTLPAQRSKLRQSSTDPDLLVRSASTEEYVDVELTKSSAIEVFLRDKSLSPSRLPPVPPHKPLGLTTLPDKKDEVEKDSVIDISVRSASTEHYVDVEVTKSSAIEVFEPDKPLSPSQAPPVPPHKQLGLTTVPENKDEVDKDSPHRFTSPVSPSVPRRRPWTINRPMLEDLTSGDDIDRLSVMQLKSVLKQLGADERGSEGELRSRVSMLLVEAHQTSAEGKYAFVLLNRD